MEGMRGERELETLSLDAYLLFQCPLCAEKTGFHSVTSGCCAAARVLEWWPVPAGFLEGGAQTDRGCRRRVGLDR